MTDRNRHKHLHIAHESEINLLAEPTFIPKPVYVEVYHFYRQLGLVEWSAVELSLVLCSVQSRRYSLLKMHTRVVIQHVGLGVR